VGIFDSEFNSADNGKVWAARRPGFIVAERLRFNEHDVTEARRRQDRYKKSTSTSRSNRSRSARGSATSGSQWARNLALPLTSPDQALEPVRAPG
jgi:hypothetical protein